MVPGKDTYEPNLGLSNPGTMPPPGAVTTQADPMYWSVYLGTRKRRVPDARENKVANQLGMPEDNWYVQRTRETATIGAMLAEFDTWTRRDFLRVRNMLAAAGYVDPEADPLTVKSAYATALQDAAMAQQNNPKLSFDEYLRNLAKLWGKDPATAGKPKRWKQVHTEKTIYELDPAEARMLVKNTIREYLGRDPSKGEIEDFMSAVQTRIEDEPRVTKTTTKYRKGGKVSHTEREVLDSGFTRADLLEEAEEQAQDAPDYAEYQAVATYFPVLEQLLGAAV